MATNYLKKLKKINNKYENKASRTLEKARKHADHCLEVVQLAIKDYQSAVSQLREMTFATCDSGMIMEGIIDRYGEVLEKDTSIISTSDALCGIIDNKFNGVVAEDDTDEDDDFEDNEDDEDEDIEDGDAEDDEDEVEE